MTMKPSQDMATIDVAQVIDQRPLSSLQILVLFLAGLTIVLDGLDIQAVAFAAPAIAADLGLERASLGPIFSAGLLGMALGSMLMGPVADRYGRRFSVLLSVALFGSFTFLTAFASSSTELLVFRFLTGLGLGGALPSLVVLVGEYSPKRVRAICAGVVLAGVPVGGLLGGLLATWAIPRFGWPSIFLIGGPAGANAAPAVAEVAGVDSIHGQSRGIRLGAGTRGHAPNRSSRRLRSQCGVCRGASACRRLTPGRTDQETF